MSDISTFLKKKMDLYNQKTLKLGQICKKNGAKFSILDKNEALNLISKKPFLKAMPFKSKMLILEENIPLSKTNKITQKIK